MFKTAIEGVSNSSQPKGSFQKQVKKQIIKQFPSLKAHIDEILPKDKKLTEAKLKGISHLTILYIGDDILFYQHKDESLYCKKHGFPFILVPHLKLLHKYPGMMKEMQCDKGGTKHIIGGSNVMAPGLLNEGGSIDDTAEVGEVVAIMAEGKKNAMAIGRMKMSPEEIRTDKKGIAVEIETYLCDGLWSFKP